MPAHNVRFTAPFDFEPAVMDEYKAAFNIDIVPADVWVCDPKANYIIGERQLDGFPSLRILATPSTGTNHIDLDACKARGVKVLSLLDDREGLETISASAEFTFKLLLDCLRKPPAKELQGKRVSLIGHGRIGRRVANWCRAFGASATWYDPPGGDFCMTLESMFFADAVVICCTLNDETRGMITGDLLRMLPHGAALVNTARGEILREDELLQVMGERPDLRVALDVVSGEVNGTADPERLRLAGARVTDHIAGETFDSRTKAARIILRLLEREFANE